MKTILCALLAISFLASCGSEPPPPPLPVHTPPELAPDLSARRLGGRETLQLAPGVVLHADALRRESPGTVTLTGHVYLDGTARAKGKGTPWWPDHAYADRAVWNVAEHALTLTGEVAAERQGAVWMGTRPETEMELDGTTIHMRGPSKTLGNLLGARTE